VPQLDMYTSCVRASIACMKPWLVFGTKDRRLVPEPDNF
jgi:hypothetical protein